MAASLSYGFDHAFTERGAGPAGGAAPVPGHRRRRRPGSWATPTTPTGAAAGRAGPATTGLGVVGPGRRDRAAHRHTAAGYYRHPPGPALVLHRPVHRPVYGPADGDGALRWTHAYTHALADLGRYYWRTVHRGPASGHRLPGGGGGQPAARPDAGPPPPPAGTTSSAACKACASFYGIWARRAVGPSGRANIEARPDSTRPPARPHPAARTTGACSPTTGSQLALGRRDSHHRQPPADRCASPGTGDRAAAAPRPSPPTSSPTSRHASATSRSAWKPSAASCATSTTPLPARLPRSRLDLYRAHRRPHRAGHRRLQHRHRLPGHPRPARPRPGPTLVPDRPRPHPGPRPTSAGRQPSANSASRLRTVPRRPRPPANPTDVLTQHLNTAAGHYHHALDLIPPTTPPTAASPQPARQHLRRRRPRPTPPCTTTSRPSATREARGDTYGAGQTRYNVALALASRPHRRRPPYAHAALANFRAVGPAAATGQEGRTTHPAPRRRSRDRPVHHDSRRTRTAAATGAISLIVGEASRDDDQSPGGRSRRPPPGRRRPRPHRPGGSAGARQRAAHRPRQCGREPQHRPGRPGRRPRPPSPSNQERGQPADTSGCVDGNSLLRRRAGGLGRLPSSSSSGTGSSSDVVGRDRLAPRQGVDACGERLPARRRRARCPSSPPVATQAASAPTTAAAGRVSSHAPAIRPATRQRTAAGARPTPGPRTAPVATCVVDSAKPRWAALRITAAARSRPRSPAASRCR